MLPSVIGSPSNVTVPLTESRPCGFPQPEMMGIVTIMSVMTVNDLMFV
jgi:hypothetical protein